MKVWAAWLSNGQGEAPSLLGLYSGQEAAEYALINEPGMFGGYTEEIEVED